IDIGWAKNSADGADRLFVHALSSFGQFSLKFFSGVIGLLRFLVLRVQRTICRHCCTTYKAYTYRNASLIKS
ncbi:MAG: hypothetical protein L0Y62_03265, partial [Nitrospirae bacterium]|nr:hypothetical protein [Nitrospirota bacterium]